VALITDPDDLNQATEVTIATGPRTIVLAVAGNLSADGVTMQALYSFLKEEWKSDALLIPHPFPMVAITDESYEFVDDWTLSTLASRKLVRTAGWSELDASSVLTQQWFGAVSLGTFEDSVNDNAYYQFGTDVLVDDTVDFTYAGPVNEPVKTFEELGNPATCDFASTSTITRASGSFITDGYKVGGAVTTRLATTGGNDGTFVLTAVAALTLTVTGTPFTSEVDTAVQLAVDNRSSFKMSLRVRDGDTNGKSFAQSALADAGVTTLSNKVERFGLTNVTDLKILETDANVDANTPYTQIDVKFFDGVYNKDVDSATGRDFGVVIDVGTHSGIDGSFSAAGTVLTSADGGIPTSTYDSGTLTIHEGTDEAATFNIVSTTATTVTINGGTFTATESAISYSLQRATPVVATLIEIYEKVQRSLRLLTDMDDSAAVIIGRAAPELLEWSGDTLKTKIITNPNTGTTDGVMIEGFDTNDTNSLVFVDNLGTERTFPFVAAGNIVSNDNLVNDAGPAEYFMFFTYTTRTSVTDFVLTSGTDVISSAGSNLPVISSGDYITISGLTAGDAAMNGVYLASGTPTAAAIDVARYDGVTIVSVAAATVNFDENPIDTPDAILVDDNSVVDITGNITQTNTAFDFDYDNNVQGGRTAATDAVVTVRALGLGTAQYVEATGTITRATGLSFSLVAALERNYENL